MRDQKNRLYFFTLVLLFFVSVLSVTFGILMYRTNLLDTYGNLMRANVTDTIQTVSYTHLDVYKRQHDYRRRMAFM